MNTFSANYLTFLWLGFVLFYMYLYVYRIYFVHRNIYFCPRAAAAIQPNRETGSRSRRSGWHQITPFLCYSQLVSVETVDCGTWKQRCMLGNQLFQNEPFPRGLRMISIIMHIFIMHFSSYCSACHLCQVFGEFYLLCSDGRFVCVHNIKQHVWCNNKSGDWMSVYQVRLLWCVFNSNTDRIHISNRHVH